jgi:hypothetical protein
MAIAIFRREARHEKHHLVVRNRRRYCIAFDALVSPQLFAGGGS